VTLGFAFTQKSTLLYIIVPFIERTYPHPLATHPRTDRFVSFHPYIYLKRNETTKAKPKAAKAKPIPGMQMKAKPAPLNAPMKTTEVKPIPAEGKACNFMFHLKTHKNRL